MGHCRHMSMDRALFQQVRERRGGEEKNMNYSLNNKILFCHSPSNIYTHILNVNTYSVKQLIEHLSVFRGMWGCIYAAGVPAVRFFKAT